MPSSFRSVVDYETPESLQQALEDAVDRDRDWLLPCADPDAQPQTVPDELQRLLTLRSYLLLDADAEQAFEELTEQARVEYNVPTSLISLVDLGRQFLFAGASGIRETPRSVAFCAHTILHKNVCVVKDTTLDARFRHNKLVTEAPHLRFYAGAPLISPEGKRPIVEMYMKKKTHFHV